MRAFTRHEGRMVPLDRADVDTDQIFPKQYGKRITRELGPYLFRDWRDSDPDFPLDRPQYQGASVLVAGENFGCGSSREHAVWAVDDAGFRVVVAPSFGDIFRNNCYKSGILPVILPEADVRHLVEQATASPETLVTVDLETRSLRCGDWEREFPIDDFVRTCLLNGWDDIGLTLRHEADIAAFEARLPEWAVPVEAEGRAR
jgi:3-isopropylmalate/(R)-2-methylmalate dehydratase small subunit